MNTTTRPALSVTAVLAYAALIVCVSMGIRHTFGLFLTPMSSAHGWGREVFSLAMAVQNLVWGATQPFAGWLADRFGARRVLWMASGLYALGLLGMAHATSAGALTLSTGLLIGVAQSGSTYSVVFAALGRLVPEARRTWAMGVVAAAGSFGQFLMIPAASALLGDLGWFTSLLIFAAAALLIMPLGTALTQGLGPTASAAGQTARQALREATGERGFLLLTAGYFVCGFQVVFIGVHFPTYIADMGMNANVGVTALALIGLFNVFGSYGAGRLGSLFPKRYLLALIYIGRSVAISLFLWLPLSPTSVYVFAAVIGVLWLSTVPLTNAIVGQVFGVRYFGMLSGLVFFSHQIGSFLGVWLGGRLFDMTGSYNTVWVICIALGVIAALLNLPVDERSLEEQGRQRAASGAT